MSARRLILLCAVLALLSLADPRLERNRVDQCAARVVRVVTGRYRVAGRRRRAGVVSRTVNGDNLVGVFEVVEIMHLFLHAVVPDSIFVYLVDLFKILMAHDLIVSTEALDDVRLAVVVHDDRLRQVAPRWRWHT